MQLSRNVVCAIPSALIVAMLSLLALVSGRAQSAAAQLLPSAPPNVPAPNRARVEASFQSAEIRYINVTLQEDDTTITTRLYPK